jgi:hypothetical protein
MEIKDERGESKRVVVQEISIGTTFYGSVDGERRLLLRTYAGLVDLGNPQKTWSLPCGNIANYQPVRAHVVVEKSL